VAKINPVKVKQDAEKEEKAGRLDKAIALYRQLVEDNPRDWNTINRVGDLYAKMNRFKEASEEYAKVADFYAKDGFLLKAIAIWKKINKLDASALEPYLNLADLYFRQGLLMEAKSQYQIVADEYTKRGRTREAGEVLRKLAEVDPADLKVRSRLADFYKREGNLPAAVEEIVAIADELGRKGHMAEALQVLEKGQAIDAKSSRLRGALARAYVAQGNVDKAAAFIDDVLADPGVGADLLGHLGEACLNGGRLAEAQKVLARLLDLDPASLDARAQLGRVHAAKGDPDRALEHLQPVVEQLAERGEADRAASLLQQVLTKSPGHVETLSILASLQLKARNKRAAVQAYSQLADACIRERNLERAEQALSSLLELDPDNVQYAAKLESVRSEASGTSAEPTGVLSLTADEMGALGETDTLGLEELPAPTGGAPEVAAEDQEFLDEYLAEGKVFRKYGLVDKAQEKFEAIIAKFPDHLETRRELGEVYKERGETQRAAEQFVAVARLLGAAGDSEAAEKALAEARELDPDVVTEAAVEEAPQPEEALELGGLATEEAAPAGELEVEIPLEVEEGGIESLEPEAPPAEPGGELGLATEPAEEARGFELEAELPAEPGLEEMSLPAAEETRAPSLEMEAPPVDDGLPGLPSLEVEAPPAEGLEFGLGAPGAEPEAPPEPLPGFEEVPPAELDLGASSPPEAAPDLGLGGLGEPEAPPAGIAAPVAEALPADLRKALDEVDSYMALGFVDDAKELLREIAARHQSHPALLEKVAQLGLAQDVLAVPAAEPAPVFEPPPPPVVEVPSLEEELGELGELAAPVFEPEPPPPPPPPPPAPPAPEAGIDLGAELSELFSAQSVVDDAFAQEAMETELGDASLNEVFREFKKGVDKQLSREDYDTRYNLGIAYKEMGLIDEAISEFQLAAKDANRMLECSSMLGICFLEKGMPQLAVKWFEKGLQAPGRREEEYQALRYDLAAALEAGGETRRALAIYIDLYGQDANLRDVAAKVRELQSALG
jgi:tetratricopeptide (TPR) repeat protein